MDMRSFGIMNQWNPAKHELREVDQARFLRERLKCPDIFIYFHKISKNWVVAYWVRKDKGWFAELKLFAQITDMNKDDVESLVQWREGKTLTGREWAEKLRAEERAMLREWGEENEELAAHKRHIGNHLNQVQRTNPEWDRPGFMVQFG